MKMGSNCKVLSPTGLVWAQIQREKAMGQQSGGWPGVAAGDAGRPRGRQYLTSDHQGPETSSRLQLPSLWFQKSLRNRVFYSVFCRLSDISFRYVFCLTELNS